MMHLWINRKCLPSSVCFLTLSLSGQRGIGKKRRWKKKMCMKNEMSKRDHWIVVVVNSIQLPFSRISSSILNHHFQINVSALCYESKCLSNKIHCNKHCTDLLQSLICYSSFFQLSLSIYDPQKQALHWLWRKKKMIHLILVMCTTYTAFITQWWMYSSFFYFFFLSRLLAYMRVVFSLGIVRRLIVSHIAYVQSVLGSFKM